MTQVFDILHYSQAIFIEGSFSFAAPFPTNLLFLDDLDIAPDFFDYFRATLPLLRSDPSLFCVSAWNDNGRQELASDNSALYRTDFFPGLGWMLTREFWNEIKGKWPAACVSRF